MVKTGIRSLDCGMCYSGNVRLGKYRRGSPQAERLAEQAKRREAIRVAKADYMSQRKPDHGQQLPSIAPRRG